MTLDKSCWATVVNRGRDLNNKFRHIHDNWPAEHAIHAIVAKKRLGHSKEKTRMRYYQLGFEE